MPVPELTSEIDDSIPLVFGEFNYLHRECNGRVQKSEVYGHTYCAVCAKMVPSRHVIPLLDRLFKTSYNEAGLES